MAYLTFKSIHRRTRVVVQVDSLVEAGAIDPEIVVTPGIFVDRVVVCPSATTLAGQGAAG